MDFGTKIKERRKPIQVSLKFIIAFNLEAFFLICKWLGPKVRTQAKWLWGPHVAGVRNI